VTLTKSASTWTLPPVHLLLPVQKTLPSFAVFFSLFLMFVVVWVEGGQKDQVTRGSFDAGSFVGGMFLVIGVLVVVAAAYIFYRWRTQNRRIAYSELK
jgi:uncharacterized membrane protein YidH (DUF202 family)